MKMLGIIGGMSPASTVTYYQMINQWVNDACGGNSSAPLLIYSVEFEQIVQYQKADDWQKAGELLAETAQNLQNAGAKAILIASNTMHKVADTIEKHINIPLLHIADATAQAIRQQGITKVALLGTAYVMQQPFYQQRLANFGVKCIVPENTVQQEIHRIIFEELTVNQIHHSSKQFYLDVIQQLKTQGAEGVILGCTEIGLLIQQADIDIPIFDTALIHARQAVDFILEKSTVA